MNKLKIFLLTTCFVFTFAISCFADSDNSRSFSTDDGNIYNYKATYKHKSFGDSVVFTFYSNSPISVSNGLITTDTKDWVLYKGDVLWNSGSDANSNFNTSPCYDIVVFEDGGEVVIPPFLRVEELPKIVGSIILLIASVGISILCLMQLPTLAKKLLLFLH